MVALREPTPDEMLADEVAKYYSDPLGYVMFMFPWDTDKSIQIVDWYSEDLKKLKPVGKTETVWEIMEKHRKRFPNAKFGPDWWACELLDQLGADIKSRAFDGAKSVEPIQYATSSGHGIGKSVLVAWLTKFILDTRPMSKGTITANTADQLRTRTWAEVGKWHRLSMTNHWFDYSTGRGSMALTSNRKDAYGNSLGKEWFCSAQTSREENSEAFAGQHAVNSTSFYIFDEASAIPDKIFEVREGGTTDGEPMTFDFGNPTRKSGRFFEEFHGRFKRRYRLFKVDSRTVYITNKKRIDSWIEDYGEESDFVKVRVRGEFPSAGSVQFMPTDSIDEAMRRPIVPDAHAPLIIGVDVARFGDDETVIYPRIGDDARSFAPKPGDGRYRKLDAVQIVGKIIESINYFKALGKPCSALFIDDGNIGGAIIDNLRHLGYNPIAVSFGGGCVDKRTYRYKSDELWGNLREAIKTRLVLPAEDHPSAVDLKTQLTQREYGYTKQGNKVHLESKDDMKARLGGDASSPDIVDALACTYAQEVATISPSMALSLGAGNTQAVLSEYDPLEQSWREAIQCASLVLQRALKPRNLRPFLPRLSLCLQGLTRRLLRRVKAWCRWRLEVVGGLLPC